MAVLATTALVAPAMAVPAVAALRSGPPDAGPPAASMAAEQTYYRDARAALSPLIVHVRDIPATLQALASTDGVSSRRLALQADGWADDCATARDLVRRLAAPPGRSATLVARLYETAAMVQGEAAAAAGRSAAAGKASRRVELAEYGQRLYELGDRMFDSAYRLLNHSGALTASELRFPPAVPQRGAGSGTGIAALAELLTAHASRAQVEDAQRGVTLPTAEAAAQEALVALRLSSLVAAEGTARVRTIGARLWNAASASLANLAVTVSQLTLEVPEETLFRGGVFDGHPPALGSGDAVGSGVPGGLPDLDSPAVLSQRAVEQ